MKQENKKPEKKIKKKEQDQCLYEYDEVHEETREAELDLEYVYEPLDYEVEKTVGDIRQIVVSLVKRLLEDKNKK